MAMITESSVQGNVQMNTDGVGIHEPFSAESLMRYSLIMTFADKMLERKILSIEDYSAFSVETAQSCGLKLPQNSLTSMR